MLGIWITYDQLFFNCVVEVFSFKKVMNKYKLVNK